MLVVIITEDRDLDFLIIEKEVKARRTGMDGTTNTIAIRSGVQIGLSPCRIRIAIKSPESIRDGSISAEVGRRRNSEAMIPSPKTLNLITSYIR